MVYDDRRIAKGHVDLIDWMTRMLFAQIPFVDRSTPAQPPAHLHHDIGLAREDMPKHWCDYR